DSLEPEFSTNEEEDRIQALTGYMLNIFEHGPDTINSDDKFDLEHSDFGDNPDSESDINNRGNFQQQVLLNFYPLYLDYDAFNPFDRLLNKRPRTDHTTLHEWFPWPNRTLELFVWLLKINGVEDIFSVKTTKELDTRLQKLYGIQTFKYKGAFGHTYYVNSLADIISQ
ncbi:hypothetical protein BDP27DRAFT_1190932, partial [Rhodocollybia butyracea]